MKYILFILLFTITSCQENIKNINPDSYLSKTEQDSFKYKIIRYIQRLPKNATEGTKFNPEFDQPYKNGLKDCDLLFYYTDSDKNIYFAISKIAPSIKIKKTATVGKLKLDEDSVVYYKEEFRTWKMEPDELQKKTKLLFLKYINQENLEEYYTVNSEPEFYIEFPDQHTFFDTLSRSWKTK